MSASKLREACGVFGLSVEVSSPLAQYMVPALKSLQHRGEDGAGIAYVKPGKTLAFVKSMGLVSDFCYEHNNHLASVSGQVAIGHIRYATQGGNTINQVQPIGGRNNQVAIAFNGQVDPKTYGTDSERLYEKFIDFLDNEDLKTLTAVSEDEAFSALALNGNCLYAFRDCRGTRPLFLAHFMQGGVRGVAIGSETCAFSHLNTSGVEEVLPGSMLVIQGGKVVDRLKTSTPKKEFCAFECMYFSREDSHYGHATMYEIRKRLGKALAWLDKDLVVKPDLTIGVPQSGLPAALGYAQASCSDFELGIIKSRYKGRSFIQASEDKRLAVLHDKLHILGGVVKDKHIVVVDDTLVRGHTMKFLVHRLKRAGAKSVHVRIASPPIVSPCTKGVDTGRETKLPASQMSIKSLEDYIGATSIKFLSLEDIKHILGNELCLDCFN